MGVNVAKEAIDLGIVTTNGDAMLTFYRAVPDDIPYVIHPLLRHLLSPSYEIRQ